MTADEFEEQVRCRNRSVVLCLRGVVSGRPLELNIDCAELNADGTGHVYVNEDPIGFDIDVNLADLETR